MASNEFCGDWGDYQNSRRRVPEDSIEYNLYVVNSELASFDLRERLRKIQNEANIFVKSLCKNYIWQREEFKLDLVVDDSNEKIHSPPSLRSGSLRGSARLRGKTNFGDSIDDEWLVVYILRQISISHPDVWIRAVDTDGQFLLIEAANALPHWLEPEVAEFRLWIHQGKLLIIPLKVSMEKASPVLSLDQALQFIRRSKSDLLSLPEIEQEAFFRLKKYPQKIQDSLHNALITVPRKIAWLLHRAPSYISPAIEAFYLRDPVALRSLQKQKASDLIFPLGDFVTISAKFTKIGYAQLIGQVISMEHAQSATMLSEGSSQTTRSQVETGMKVTAGFEILLSDSLYKDMRAVREMKLLLDDLDEGEETLPTDQDIRQWDFRADSDSWLDVNFADLDKSLSKDNTKESQGLAGFADKTMEDHLSRVASRFTSLMEGAGDELNEEDSSNSSSDDESFTPDITGNKPSEVSETSFEAAKLKTPVSKVQRALPEQLDTLHCGAAIRCDRAHGASAVQDQSSASEHTRQVTDGFQVAGAIDPESTHAVEEASNVSAETVGEKGLQASKTDVKTGDSEVHIDMDKVHSMLCGFAAHLDIE